MAREFIDNHWYLVERDDKGNILSQIGDDPPAKAVDVDRISAAAIAAKANLTTGDQSNAIKLILKKVFNV